MAVDYKFGKQVSVLLGYGSPALHFTRYTRDRSDHVYLLGPVLLFAVLIAIAFKDQIFGVFLSLRGKKMVDGNSPDELKYGLW
ncbi:hypothetical protein ACS5PU_03865 [Pedobacter sp. GSP4]|uniref:hypothetical protein n=1 Tax=Pedobacter sp. GSP4 TaxID=3453716 RepID=UPI003EEBCDC2